MMIDAILNVVGPWWFVLAILVAVAGTARYARLVTYDVFPPSIRFRRVVRVHLRGRVAGVGVVDLLGMGRARLRDDVRHHLRRRSR
jgi:hypothetical protein